jgi:hypothetical protein
MNEALTVSTTRLQNVESLLDEDASVLAAKYHVMHEQTMQQLNDALAEAKIGTATYLNHLIAREKLEANYLSTLMDLGLIRRAPVNYNVERFDFKATVGLMPDAALHSRTAPFIDAETD